MRETQFIIVKLGNEKLFLMHVGHSHQYTTDQELAMVYTKQFVATDLANKMDGKVIPIS